MEANLVHLLVSGTRGGKPGPCATRLLAREALAPTSESESWFTSTSKCLRKHGRVLGLAKMAESGWRWGRAIACVVVQPASLTEYTGGSRVAALNHVRPASAEPNTSPDVAPK